MTQTPELGVIYARYSSSGQREESIEGQVRECRAYAEKYNIRIIDEYCDSALTGKNDRRPEFQRMIKDSAKGKFTVVLMWKIDRFARTKYDNAVYKHKLKQNGVRVAYAKEFIPEGPEGIVFESLMEGFAEYYSANLSQNVKRGNYESALKLQTLGQFCYGLQKGADGRWEQNPETAPVVKRIFEEYTGGKPSVEICKDLNNEGYRTYYGNRFGRNSIRGILRNEKYCGVYKFDDIRVEDGIPAIIDKETYNKAQAMLATRHEKPALKKLDGGFLLSGKLFCGHCSEPMVGDSGTGKSGRVYKYYTCANRLKKKCKKKRVTKDSIEDHIVAELSKIVHSDELIASMTKKFLQWQNEQVSPALGLEKRLKSVEQSIANNLKVIDSGFVSDAVTKHLRELEIEKAELENAIFIEKYNTPKFTEEQIMYYLRSFRNGKNDDVAWRIYLIETFLRAAYLYDDGRLLLCLNFTGEESEISVNMAEETASDGIRLCSDFAPIGLPKEKSFIAR